MHSNRLFILATHSLVLLLGLITSVRAADPQIREVEPAASKAEASEAPPATPPAPAAPCPAPAPNPPRWQTPLPRPGYFTLPPGGPGYYSVLDQIRGNELQAPPKYPYPRVSPIFL